MGRRRPLGKVIVEISAIIVQFCDALPAVFGCAMYSGVCLAYNRCHEYYSAMMNRPTTRNGVTSCKVLCTSLHISVRYTISLCTYQALLNV